MNWSYTLSELAEIVGAEPPTMDGTFTGVSTDTRTLRQGDAFFALSGEQFDGNAFVQEALMAGAAGAVTRETGADGRTIVVPDPLDALQRFAADHRRRFDIPVIAVTGSCGKTTSKDMIAGVLESKYRVVKTPGNLNNHIGCPLSLLRIDAETQFAVFEIGANHIGEIRRICEWVLPTESAITMISEAHLEGFGSIEQVAEAKGEIVECLPKDGIFYVNADDSRCVRIGESFEGKKIRFGTGGDVFVNEVEHLGQKGMRLQVHPIGELVLPIYVPAHLSDVLLAVAVGLQHGIEDFQTPLELACRNTTRFRIRTIGPLVVFDDSYNANPASVRAAIDAIHEWPATGRRVAALGDMLELGSDAADMHRTIGEYAASNGIERVFAKGEYAPSIAEGGRREGMRVDIIDDHLHLAEAIATYAEPGDVLLVKGSRGMAMEKVIDHLQSLYESDIVEGA